MKRIVLVLGVAAALAVPSVASAGPSPQKKARVPAFDVALHSTQDDRSGQTLYRLGSSGLWMQ